MKIRKTKFKDLLIIKHELFPDERGYFKELIKKEPLEKILGYEIEFCQQNYVNSKLNVLRGLHFQNHPNAQSKLISVHKGKILDVAVDIRLKSKTYGKYFSYVLSSDQNESLFIPKGFAHGYLTLSNDASVSYLVDNYYCPELESGIKFNDKFLNIDWGTKESIIKTSLKDKNLGSFNEK